MAEPEPKEPDEGNFMSVLEKGIRDVLKNRKATASERIQAITAGAKLMMIRHRISGDDTKGFFD